MLIYEDIIIINIREYLQKSISILHLLTVMTRF